MPLASGLKYGRFCPRIVDLAGGAKRVPWRSHWRWCGLNATDWSSAEWLVVDDEQIFRKNRDDLIRYAAVLVGPTAGEDVVSTVVLRVLARRRLGDLDDARAYLFRAVLNECKTRLSRTRTQPLGNVELTEPSVDEPRPEVFEAVMGLPAQQRAATYLVYWAGMSTLEAAELMGLRPGTVSRYLHLARHTLKGVLDVT